MTRPEMPLVEGRSVCSECNQIAGQPHYNACTVGQRVLRDQQTEAVDHPAHYGGADDPYEAIKVIEAWGLGFHLGNTVKYISRCGRKAGESVLKDLKKARWYLDRKIELLEKEQSK